MNRMPTVNEYAPYFGRYIALVPEHDPMPALEGQARILTGVAASVPGSKETFRYGEGKWNIREVFGHLTDAERVFGYRAFCISRGEEAPLPAFDENSYVDRSGYGERTLQELVGEFALVREANLRFLAVLTDDQWQKTGTASGKTISVRALAYIMAGHVRHHLTILNERYGVGHS